MITNSFDKFPNEPTGLMYEQFGKIGLNPALAPTYTPTIETADWTLTNNGGSATIANNELTIVANSNGDNPIATYDLGATISDTQWLMTFQVVYSGFQNSASGNGTKLGIGIGSSSSTTDLAGWNISGSSFIEYDFRGHASTSVWQPYVSGGNSSGRTETAGSNYPDGGGYSATHYVKLYRLTSTTGKMEFYLQSDYSDTPVTLNVTMANVPSGLRYVFARSEYENVPDTNTFVISNFKIYNGVTSVSPASPKVKQHFIEWFSGKQIPSYWTKTDIQGTNQFLMQDDSSQGGGGFSIITGTTSSDQAEIDFNNKRQYSQTGSVFIMVARRNSNPALFRAGFTGNITDSNTNRTVIENDSSQSKFRLGCYDASTGGETATSQDVNGYWWLHKEEFTSTSLTLKMNGTLEATRTTNLPSIAQQPYFFGQTLSGASSELSIRYMECYNT